MNTSGATRLEDAHEHSERHGGGAEAADKHHLGRDAAVGGGLGAVAYEAGQSNPAKTTSTTTTTASGPSHQTNPVVDSNTSKEHHYGRDAALGVGAGAGAAGIAEQ